MTKTRQIQIHRPWQRHDMTCELAWYCLDSDSWEPNFMTIVIVTWQLRVTLDSLRNSCDVLLVHFWFLYFVYFYVFFFLAFYSHTLQGGSRAFLTNNALLFNKDPLCTSTHMIISCRQNLQANMIEQRTSMSIDNCLTLS